MATSGMVRAAILARVSTAEQGTDEKVSIPDQVAACRREIERREWVEHAVYPDICSGATLDRPELGKILAEAAQGNIQVVVATRVDRVARDLLDLLILERDLRSHGIALVLTDFPVDTTTDLGRFSLQQMGAAAELEKNMIRRRTMSGRRGSVAKGGWPGGDPPYGFQVVHTVSGKHVDKRLQHDPAEVEVIGHMVERLLDEGLSLEDRTPTKIAEWLNARGYAPRKAPRWTSSIVRWTLRQETLIGRLVYAKPAGKRNERKQRQGRKNTHHSSGEWGEPIVMEIPPILDRSTFDAVQAELQETGLGSRADALVYLLSGRLTMPCGRVAHGWYRKDRDRRLYRCAGVRRHVCDSCHQIDADEVEAAVWEEVTRALSDPERVARLVQVWQDAQPGNTDTGLLERRIVKVRAALERAYVAGLSSGLDPDALKAATASLQQDLKVLERERDSATAARLEAAEVRRRAAGLKELAARMDTMSARDRQHFLRLLDVQVAAAESGVLQISGWLPFGPAEAWDGSSGGASRPRSCQSYCTISPSPTMRSQSSPKRGLA
jgi:site-specific DNA recombinase